jgi:ADP-dependent NAD(P)H-hydrate dehydratase / NAD(P)H-hydrate epimerase
MAGGGYMVKLFSVSEMKALEKEANDSGLTYDEMMENAGKGIAKEIDNAYRHLDNQQVIALVGSGNNGGDALVALSYLSQNKWETCAYIVRPREPDDPLISRLIEDRGKVLNLVDDKKYIQLVTLLETSSVLIDGVLGTGIKLPLKGDTAKILSFVQQYQETEQKKLHIVAVDCPSGVDCETGEVAEETIPAEMTVTMAGAKLGLLRFPAARLTGELHFASIGQIEGYHAYTENKKFIVTRELVTHNLPSRPIDAHKGTFGTAFIIAGSVNFTGAALLAGLAAYRIGAGLVTMAVPAPLHEALAGQFPESTWVLLPHEVGVISADAANVAYENSSRATAILIGPGFGMEDTTKEFLSRFLIEPGSHKKSNIGFIHPEESSGEWKNLHIPMVVDADGLKLLSKIEGWADLLPPGTVLTPHPGEMAYLTGLPVEKIQEDRIEVARKYSSSWGHIVVLKGAFTVIAAPDNRVAVIPVASPALARAGTGDVLAGLIVGLRAQGVDAFEAAYTGAWIHAHSGLLAARCMGNTASVIAGDVVKAVPQVITELQ